MQQSREKGRDENRGSGRKEEGNRERVEGHGECMAALLCGYGCEPCGCEGCEGGDRPGSSYPDPDTDPNPNPSPNPKPQSVTVDESVAVVDSGSVDNSPASQGLLFPIEAIKSKGSQREIPTCPDSDSVGYDRLTCPFGIFDLDKETDTSTLSDPREHARLTSPLTLKQGQETNSRQTENEAVKTSPHGVSPGMPQGTAPRPSGLGAVTPGIKDAAPALYNYVCSVLQLDRDPNPTNPGHSVLPSEMAPRTNPVSARLINGSPAEARCSSV